MPAGLWVRAGREARRRGTSCQESSSLLAVFADMKWIGELQALGTTSVKVFPINPGDKLTFP